MLGYTVLYLKKLQTKKTFFLRFSIMIVGMYVLALIV